MRAALGVQLIRQAASPTRLNCTSARSSLHLHFTWHHLAQQLPFSDSNRGFQAGIINGPVHNELHAPPGRSGDGPVLRCANGHALH
jgi:hypothetical protein